MNIEEDEQLSRDMVEGIDLSSANPSEDDITDELSLLDGVDERMKEIQGDSLTFGDY